MPGCTVTRSERAGRAIYSLAGKLDGATALELKRRIDEDCAGDISIDFSLVEEFVDYGVAVLAQVLDQPKRLQLLGLRQHTVRLFKYFGVDFEAHARPLTLVTGGDERFRREKAAREVG